MKKYPLLMILATGFVLITAGTARAQMERQRVNPPAAVEETFWTPGLVGLGTVETIGQGSLNVTIMHNFGILTDRTLQNFFGLDFGPNVRLGIDYGITDAWTLGVGRTSFDKVVDMRSKVRLLQQSGGVPFSLALKTDAALTTVENRRPVGDDLSLLVALPVARRLSDWFSLQLTPLYGYYGFADQQAGEQSQLWALGTGVQVTLSRRYALMAEYYPVLGERNPGTTNAFALGLNIETGGHVFQLYLASSHWHTEQYIIARNQTDFWAGDFRFGFNVNRLF